MIRNILVRASLRGMLLGAGLGGLYAAAFGTLIFPFVFTAFGFIFGAFAGAVLGFPLGLLDGLLLCWLAATYRDIGPADQPRFRVLAEILCVAGTFLALLTDWALHGLPDPDGFAVFRACLLFPSLLVSDKYLQHEVPLDLVSLSIWVLAPMAIALAASWLTAGHVVGRYLNDLPNS